MGGKGQPEDINQECQCQKLEGTVLSVVTSFVHSFEKITFVVRVHTTANTDRIISFQIHSFICGRVGRKCQHKNITLDDMM